MTFMSIFIFSKIVYQWTGSPSAERKKTAFLLAVYLGIGNWVQEVDNNICSRLFLRKIEEVKNENKSEE